MPDLDLRDQTIRGKPVDGTDLLFVANPDGTDLTAWSAHTLTALRAWIGTGTGDGRLRFGTGTPAGSLGIVGDAYRDTTTGNFYEKTAATVWTKRADGLTAGSMAPGNTPGSASAGSATTFARSDHDHGITPGSGGATLSDSDPLALAATASEGTASEASRQDHVHPTTGLTVLTTSGTPAPPGTANRGTGTTAARADHVHPKQTIADTDIPASIARDSELPAANRLIPAGGSQGQVLKKSSASDYAVAWAADQTGSGGGGGASLSDNDPVALAATASEGTGTAAARDDHVHPTTGLAAPTTTLPVAAGPVAFGTDTGYARGDHVHPKALPNIPAWQTRTAYVVGDHVRFSGAGRHEIFVCISNVAAGTTSPPPALPDNWLELDQYNGEWAANNAYPKGHIVDHVSGSGQSAQRRWYIAQSVTVAADPAPDHEDNTKWVLFAGGTTGGGGSTVAAHTPAAGDDELAGLDIDGTDYELVDRQGRDRLRLVEQRVHPIHETARTWQTITDTTAGWVVSDDQSPTLSSLTYAQAAVSGTVAQFVFVRIPTGSQQSNYRLQFVEDKGTANEQTRQRVLGTWSGERVGGGTAWQYYRIAFYEGTTFADGVLQVGVSGEYTWEGALTEQAVEDQLEGLGIPQQLGALKNVTRDLHLDGVTRLVKNSAAATAAVARVAVANADRQAIEAGTTSLNVQGVTFTASLSDAHFGTTATTTDLPIIRLAQTEDRSDWRILFDTATFLAGGWVPITVTNGTAGYDYYISSKVDRSQEIALYRSEQETTYTGDLAAGIVDPDDLSATGTPSASTFLRGDNTWAAPPSDPVVGSNTIRKEDTGVLQLRAPDLHLGLWGRSADDNTVPQGADDPANAVPVRLTEVRSNDQRTTAQLSDVQYDAAGPQGNPEVVGTIKVLHTADTTIVGFGTGAGYDATKPGFVWDQTNSRFHHNGVAASVANSGSATNKFRLRVEVDYKRHIAVGSDSANLRLELDVPVKFGVDRQHDWRNINLRDFPTTEVRTLSYQVDIQSAEAPAVTDYMTVALRSIQSTSQVLFVEAVRIHFILPDSNNVNYLQEYDLNNAVTWVGRNVLGPAVGSHTNNQTAAGVKIVGGRLEATEDIAVLQLIANARTGVAANGHSIRLMTRVPGLQAPTVLHEWDDSTNVWRIVYTVKAVLSGQEFWVEADAGATYSSVGSPNLVWDSTRHDSGRDRQSALPRFGAGAHPGRI